ncbi:MAG: NADH-quinone oxidoreductase subunit 5 family protein [Candidatus Ranarchaeia archaeon]|jgi:NADH-quinone oxidoreductase subunit L
MFLPLSPWLVWVIPFIGAALLPIVARISPKLRGPYSLGVSLFASLFAVDMVIDLLTHTHYHGPTEILWVPGINLFAGVNIDPVSVFFATFAIIIGTLIVLYSIGYMAHEKEGVTRYYFLVLLFLGGMTCLAMSNNFLQMFIAWEVMGNCSYALIGFWYKKPSAAKAGMKAFVVTRVGDVFLLIAICLIYVNVGSFGYSEVALFVEEGKMALSLLTMLGLFSFMGAAGKSAQVPLHVWIPDAMEGPTPVSALIHAACMVKAGLYLIVRSWEIFHMSVIWLDTVMWIGAITAFLTATIAIVQTDVKKILAYSTMSQLGMITAALGYGTELGLFAGEFHIWSHAIFKALLFLAAGSVIHAVGTNDIKKMGGLAKYMPITCVTSIIGALALSGMPPLNGFWSKDLILAGALHAQHWIPLALLWGTSLLTAAYSVRWIGMIWFGEPSDHLKTLEPPNHDHDDHSDDSHHDESHSSDTHQEIGIHNVKESPLVMTIPLIILAGLVLIIGFGAINIGIFPLTGMSEHLFAEFLHSHVAGGIELIPLLLSLSAFGIGAGLSYLVYFKKAFSTEKFIQSRVGGTLHALLWNGYYFDAVYERVFVQGLLGFGTKVWKTVEQTLLEKPLDRISLGTQQFARNSYMRAEDGGMQQLNYSISNATKESAKTLNSFDQEVVDGTVNGIAKLGKKASNLLQRLQSGVPQHYVSAFVFGLTILILIVIFLFGGL